MPLSIYEQRKATKAQNKALVDFKKANRKLDFGILFAEPIDRALKPDRRVKKNALDE